MYPRSPQQKFNQQHNPFLFMQKIVGIIFSFILILSWSVEAAASFDRELENLNRKRSMEILDEFNEDIDRQIGVVDLTPEQIRRSLQAEQEFEKERAARDQEAEKSGKKKPKAKEIHEPVIPKEQLKELLGLQMENSQNENIPLDIRTDIGMKTKRDSNVFERRIDAVGETQFSYYPGVHGTARVLGWDSKTDYKMTRLLHMNFIQNDRVDHTWSQKLSRKYSKTTWSFAGDLYVSSLPSEAYVIKPRRYYTSRYGGGVSYDLTRKTTLGASYLRTGTTYMSDTANSADAQSHAFDLNIAYAMSARTKFRSGCTFTISRPPKGVKSDNINVYKYYLGMDGRISEKLFYNLLGALNYSKRSVEASAMNEFISFAAVFTYAYSPKTRYTLKLQRDQVTETTLTESDPLNHYVELGVSHKLTNKITLSAAESLRLISDDDAFPTTVIDPDYTPLTYTDTRRESQWGTKAGLKYNIDLSSNIAFDYTYLDVDTNLKLNDRINHICEVSYVKKF